MPDASRSRADAARCACGWSAPRVGRVARVQHHQPRVVDPAVGIFEAGGVARLRAACRPASLRQIQRARRPAAAPAAQMVVQEQAEPHHPGRPQPRWCGSTKRSGQMMCGAMPPAAPRARSAPRAPAGTRSARDSAGRRGSAWSKRDDVPLARSPCSHSNTDRPRPAASRAMPHAVDAAADDREVENPVQKTLPPAAASSLWRFRFRF